MGFIKTAYRAMQTRFAAFMWAHADEAFVRGCINDCVELLDTDVLAAQISEQVISGIDIGGIESDVRDHLIDNTDVDSDEIVREIAENIDTSDIASEVASSVIEDISVSQVSDEIVETVGDEIKDDCIEQIMEQIEEQREGWAEVLAQRLVKNDEFVAALAVALLRTNKEASDATA